MFTNNPVPTHDPAYELANAIDVGYRFRPGEMLRWTLSAILQLWGIKQPELPPEEAKHHIQNAIKVYQEAIQRSPPFTDILGTTYMALVSRWGKSVLGQYFTPQAIALMMARMSYSPADEPEEGRLLSTCDPCIGSGVMMLSFMQVLLQQEGPGGLLRWSFSGIDIDPICAQMFAVQVIANCAIHDLHVGELVVYQGNALGSIEGLRLVVHATAPSLTQPVVPPMHPARIAALQQAARQQMDQIPLFASM